jgi:hypothetical protein
MWDWFNNEGQQRRPAASKCVTLRRQRVSLLDMVYHLGHCNPSFSLSLVIVYRLVIIRWYIYGQRRKTSQVSFA